MRVMLSSIPIVLNAQKQYGLPVRKIMAGITRALEALKHISQNENNNYEKGDCIPGALNMAINEITAIRDSAFTPTHWWIYSHFVALPLGWGAVAIYSRRIPILRCPGNSIPISFKITIIGYFASMFTIGVNELWHFWFIEEIFEVPNHWMFNTGIALAFIGALGFVVEHMHV